jgi:hypothetical protein
VAIETGVGHVLEETERRRQRLTEEIVAHPGLDEVVGREASGAGAKRTAVHGLGARQFDRGLGGAATGRSPHLAEVGVGDACGRDERTRGLPKPRSRCASRRCRRIGDKADSWRG